MKTALIVLVVCMVLVTISAVVYAIGEYRKIMKSKPQYPFYCRQPKTALRNHCNYYGAFANECLCSYKGCNFQGCKKQGVKNENIF